MEQILDRWLIWNGSWKQLGVDPRGELLNQSTMRWNEPDRSDPNRGDPWSWQPSKSLRGLPANLNLVTMSHQKHRYHQRHCLYYKKKDLKVSRKLEEGSRKCRDNIGHEAFDVERSQFDIYFKSNNGFNRNDPISFCTTVNFSKEGFYLCEPLTTTCRSILVPKSLPLPISFAIPYPSFLATDIGSWNWETRCSKCLPYFPWKIGQRFVMEKPRP